MEKETKMTQHEIERLREVIKAMTDEEKKIALEELLSEGVTCD